MSDQQAVRWLTARQVTRLRGPRATFATLWLLDPDNHLKSLTPQAYRW
jgi:hypothetical protein